MDRTPESRIQGLPSADERPNASERVANTADAAPAAHAADGNGDLLHGDSGNDRDQRHVVTNRDAPKVETAAEATLSAW